MPESITSRPHNPLLFDEYPLLVPPRLAAAIGLNEAILLQQIHYWLGKSGKLRDGRLWIYNTYEDWQAQLPFWSVRTIRRIVAELERRGLLVSSSEHNAAAMDRTKWYAIDYDALGELAEPGEGGGEATSPGDEATSSPSVQNGHLHMATINEVDTPRSNRLANLATWSGQNGHMQPANLATPIPETTQRLTTENEKRDINAGEEKFDSAQIDIFTGKPRKRPLERMSAEAWIRNRARIVGREHGA